MKIYRKNPQAQNGYNNGDIDVAFQLFSCGMVWSGNLASKDARDHLVSIGYAISKDGMHAMTGKGVFAFLKHPQTWKRAWANKRRKGTTQFVVSPRTILKALD